MKRWIELLPVLALIGWRLFRKSMDGYGPWFDWLLVAGVMWAVWIFTREHRRLREVVLVAGCSYLFVLYGYFQLGSTVSLFWMLVEGM